MSTDRSHHPSRSLPGAIGLLLSQDDPDALLHWNPAAPSRSDDDLVNRNLEDLAPTRRRQGTPGLLAQVVVQQDRKIEVWRGTELLLGVEQRIALGCQAGHHDVPPGGVLGAHVLAADEPGFFEIEDAASH